MKKINLSILHLLIVIVTFMFTLQKDKTVIVEDTKHQFYYRNTINLQTDLKL